MLWSCLGKTVELFSEQIKLYFDFIQHKFLTILIKALKIFNFFLFSQGCSIKYNFPHFLFNYKNAQKLMSLNANYTKSGEPKLSAKNILTQVIDFLIAKTFSRNNFFQKRKKFFLFSQNFTWPLQSFTFYSIGDL